MKPRPAVLAVALLSLSFSTVLFTLAIFKLLSFFIMPSLFFDLLFIGFPVGAFVGAIFYRAEVRSLLRTLWILIGVAFASVAGCLLCKNFDYLRAHLFEVEIPQLLGQIGVFTGLFIPYFAAYGLSEYVGYQLGTAVLAGRMRVVYALYLFGAALAYVTARAALGPLGISALLALSVFGMTVAAALLSSGRRWRTWILAAGLASVGGLPLFQGSQHPIERIFLSLYKGTSMQSSKDLAAKERAVPVFQTWGKYSFTEILKSERDRSYKGLYNDFFQWEYAPGVGFNERSLGEMPLWLVPKDGAVAIIGAGGGRQVRYAQVLGLTNILALEIETAVADAVRGPLADKFDQVYAQPGTRLVVQEARSFMEASRDAYDLIYLPSVGGYPQMMLEPGNLIRTLEAYRTLRDRLTPQGTLAIWYPAGLDPRGILTDQYVRTLRSLEMDAVALATVTRADTSETHEILILASRRDPAVFGGVPPPVRAFLESEKLPPSALGLEQLLNRFFVAPRGVDPRAVGLASNPLIEAREVRVPEDPFFVPITDEKPFLAGNVRHIFSLEQVYKLFASVGGLIVVAAAALYVILRRRGDPRIAGRPWWSVAALSLLIGANFLLVEHFLVLQLFRRVFVFYDSLVLGAVAFLVLSGLGSIVLTSRLRRPAIVLALFAMALQLWVGLGGTLPGGFASIHSGALPILLLAWPGALVTGCFFPLLFERAQRNQLGVFAMDAVGAAIGSLISFFLPIAFGFRAFFVVVAVVFALTATAHVLFHRGLDREA